MAGKSLRFAIALVLIIVDFIIDVMLFTRLGERTIKPTDRVAFPRELKERLHEKQERRCMYCGVQGGTSKFQIDHMDPVVRGGSNEESNLQLLCGSCNLRKGIQTDQEFRKRYHQLLPATRAPTPKPPQQRIQQSEFSALTRKTVEGEDVRHFRRSKFISPLQKIITGSVVLGIAVAIAWVFLVSSLAQNAQIADILAVYGLFIVGIATAAGFIWRAHITGKTLEDDDQHGKSNDDKAL